MQNNCFCWRFLIFELFEYLINVIEMRKWLNEAKVFALTLYIIYISLHSMSYTYESSVSDECDIAFGTEENNMISQNKRNQSFVFNSGQKMALRTFYFINVLWAYYYIRCSQRHLLATFENKRLVSLIRGQNIWWLIFWQTSWRTYLFVGKFEFSATLHCSQCLYQKINM